MKINHNILMYGIFVLALIIILSIIFMIIKNRRSRDSMERRWKEIQKLLKHESNWNEAIIEADKLLDEALKAKHYKGKTMGERLVSAQHQLTANDMVWYSHKLRNKLDNKEKVNMTKSVVKKTFLGFWQALKDLGAFSRNEK